MILTERIEKTKVKTMVDNNTNNRGNKTTVITSNTIGTDSLAVNVNEAIELMLPSTLSGFGKTCKTLSTYNDATLNQNKVALQNGRIYSEILVILACSIYFCSLYCCCLSSW